MYYVYLIKSVKNRKLYLGCTNDLENRLLKHNAGKIYSTKRDTPFELVYCEIYKSKDDAFGREQKLKYYGQGFRRLKERLKNSLK
ncbi:MAG: GIY-YIG nuclease family protein [Patescibacteria group bacterium]